MKKYIALILGKIASNLLKLLNKFGGSLPGKIAIKICPDILKYFKYPPITILVTGTNGKTSTANMINKVFTNAGYKTISNSRGDNIINGIATVLIKNSNYKFKIKSEVLVLEVDELTLAKQIKYIKATDIVITNFFRDQLDRAGEMETIISKISNSLKEYKNNLYLNEDDPNVKRLSYSLKSAKTISFGVEKIKNAKLENYEAKEGKFCPLCNNPIKYNYYQYSHIGSYFCTKCSFKSEKPRYLAHNLSKDSFYIDGDKYYFSIDATYHIYNLCAVISIAKNYNIDPDTINFVIKDFSLGIGRMENIKIQEKNILLNLVKNPTGCNEIIKFIENQSEDKTLLFLLNDNTADGKDTSWIWDVNFENIKNLKKVILTGKRAYEMAIRFKIAEITDNIVVEKDIEKAVNLLLKEENKLFVISTYTGLFNIRNILLNKQKGDK